MLRDELSGERDSLMKITGIGMTSAGALSMIDEGIERMTSAAPAGAAPAGLVAVVCSRSVASDSGQAAGSRNRVAGLKRCSDRRRL